MKASMSRRKKFSNWWTWVTTALVSYSMDALHHYGNEWAIWCLSLSEAIICNLGVLGKWTITVASLAWVMYYGAISYRYHCFYEYWCEPSCKPYLQRLMLSPYKKVFWYMVFNVVLKNICIIWEFHLQGKINDKHNRMANKQYILVSVFIIIHNPKLIEGMLGACVDVHTSAHPSVNTIQLSARNIL